MKYYNFFDNKKDRLPPGPFLCLVNRHLVIIYNNILELQIITQRYEQRVGRLHTLRVHRQVLRIFLSLHLQE